MLLEELSQKVLQMDSLWAPISALFRALAPRVPQVCPTGRPGLAKVTKKVPKWAPKGTKMVQKLIKNGTRLKNIDYEWGSKMVFIKIK